MFLPEPPEEHIPIPDFRTMRDARLRRPSPDLLDTIYLCQQRQDWFHDFAVGAGYNKRAFVGSLAPGTDVRTAADAIRKQLAFSTDARRQSPTWTEAVRAFIQLAEDLGALVMVSGVVGNNTHRKLDPEEFRGFALVDDYAPLIFVNGADTKAAQMFTLHTSWSMFGADGAASWTPMLRLLPRATSVGAMKLRRSCSSRSKSSGPS